MSNMSDLPKALQNYVNRKVASGEFSSSDDVLEEAAQILDLYEQRLGELRNDIDKGLASGKPVDAGEVFDALRERHKRRLDANGPR